MIFSLAACGGSGDTNAPDNAAQPENNEQTGAEETAEPEEPEQEALHQVLIDDENCTLAWTGYEVNEDGDTVFRFQCDNKSADAKLQFLVTSNYSLRREKEYNMLINGYLIRSFNSYNTFRTVDSGKSEEACVVISAKDLKALGMTAVDRLDLPIGVQMNGTDYIEEAFTLYPTGLDEATFTVPERVALETDRVCADYEEFKYIIVGADENATYYLDYDNRLYMLYVYVQNNFDNSIVFTTGKYTVNGVDLGNMGNTSEMYEDSDEIPAKSEGLYTIAIGKGYLESLGVTEPEELVYELEGRIYTGSGYNSDKFVEGAPTIDLTKLRKID